MVRLLRDCSGPRSGSSSAAFPHRSVRLRPDHGDVLLLARLVCSDVACADEAEASVGSLAELDALACACGCTLELLAVSLDAGELRTASRVPAPLLAHAA